nr:MAG TPA: hypothetical protein [Caudoviricetes sp.]
MLKIISNTLTQIQTNQKDHKDQKDRKMYKRYP